VGLDAAAEAVALGTWARCAVPTFCGSRTAASWDGWPFDGVGPATAVFPDPAAAGADELEAAHAVTANAETTVRPRVVANLLGRTVFDNSQIWLDEGGFAAEEDGLWELTMPSRPVARP
jgi:hypothetical protein